MPVRNSLKNGGIYHIYNRGINKCEIFHDHQGYSYFISLLDHCRQYATPLSTFHKSKNKPPRLEITDIPVDIYAYCIMPNHFHLLLQQRINDGISAYISRVCNGYTKGYNIRFERTGPLWEGRFKAKEIGDDSSYLQVIRYIHLNPVVSIRTKCINPLEYRYSSYADTVKQKSSICNTDHLYSILDTAQDYQTFINATMQEPDFEFVQDLLIDQEILTSGV